MGRLESNLNQFSFSDSAKTTHHSPAKPPVVSTSLPVLVTNYN